MANSSCTGRAGCGPVLADVDVDVDVDALWLLNMAN